MKKIIKILIVIILIFLIYIITKDKKIFYLNISDTENPYSLFLNSHIKEKNKLEKYVNKFSREDYRITDLKNDIEINKNIMFDGKKLTIKNALVKADIITLSIGNTDLYYKINFYDVNEMYDYVDNLLIDYENLFKLIRKITKEKIIVFGYTYSNNNVKQIIDYYNKNLKELCYKNKINFIYIDKNTKKNIVKEVKNILK